MVPETPKQESQPEKQQEKQRAEKVTAAAQQEKVYEEVPNPAVAARPRTTNFLAKKVLLSNLDLKR